MHLKPADPGDLVCVFLGGRTSYIIRDVGSGRCQFIAECYVTGPMNGEAMEDVENGKYTLEDITLECQDNQSSGRPPDTDVKSSQNTMRHSNFVSGEQDT